MKEKVIILGGKGTAVVIAEQIYEAQHRYGSDIEVLGFAFDDPAYAAGINGWPVLCGTREAYEKYKDDSQVKFVFGMYRSDIIEQRVQLRDSYGIPQERFLTFIHPSAFVAKSAKIGSGCIIMAHCTINSNVTLGNFCTIQSGTIIEHDSVLGDSNFLAAHTVIGSNVNIKNGNFFGLNSSIRNYTRIGDYNIAGMAANVIKEIPSHCTVVGNPAHILVK